MGGYLELDVTAHTVSGRLPAHPNYMQRFNLSDLLSPLVVLWEWNPVIATLIFSIVLGCVVYANWRLTWRKIQKFSRAKAFVWSGLFAVAVFGFVQFMSFLTLIPVSIECGHAPHSMIIPPDGRLSLLSLNAIPEESGGGGIAQVTSQAGTEWKWPPLSSVYRCHLTNYGSDPVFNMELALTMKFLKANKDEKNPSQSNSGAVTLVREWIISIPKIESGPGGTFDFYIDNPSQQFVFVSLPPSVTFHRANSDSRERSNLIQVPGLMMHFTPYP